MEVLLLFYSNSYYEEIYKKQESIPVGCVPTIPTAAVAKTRCQYTGSLSRGGVSSQRGSLPRGGSLSRGVFLHHHPVDRQALLKTLPSLAVGNNICLTSVTRAKPKEKNEICHSISTRAIKCDGVFFVLQHGF